MFKTTFALLGLFFAVSSCNQIMPGEEPDVESKKLTKKEGNCEGETSCFVFDVSYPEITNGGSALRDSLQAWVETTVYGLSVQAEETQVTRQTLQKSCDDFYAMWKINKEMPAPFAFEARDTILYKDANHLCIRYNFYMFSGGAHPNTHTELSVFEVKTGKKVPVETYIKDKNAVLPLIDAAYKAEFQEAFNDGFTYQTENGEITFPAQTAFTDKGVLFHYNAYEIAPYVMGDFNLVLTWTDLGDAGKKPF